jgi:hypothetical protein
VAWLGLLAVWLTIVAPVVSRTMPAAAAVPDLGAWCEAHAGHHMHGGHAGHGMPGHPDDDGLDCCGYCALLGHTPALAGAAFAFALAAPPAVAPAPLPAFVPVAAAERLGPPPRGPPAFVSI